MTTGSPEQWLKLSNDLSYLVAQQELTRNFMRKVAQQLAFASKVIEEDTKSVEKAIAQIEKLKESIGDKS